MIDQAEKLRQVIDNLKKHTVNQVFTTVKPVKRSARIITVTSGKGGVGKTNVAINLAIALSGLGQRVIIIDADFGLANIDVLFGIIPKYTLEDVIKKGRSILEVLSEGPRNIRFISGGSGVEDLIRLDKAQVQLFVEKMALLDKLADIIIVDTGAGLSDNVMNFVMAADEVLLITTPEPTSITDSYALIKMVSNRDKEKKVRIIVNRADNAEEANDIINKLILVTDKFLGMTLEPIGHILQDDAIIKAVKLQQPFSICFPKSQAARNINDISIKLVGNKKYSDELQNPGIRGFLSKLIALLGA